MRVLITQSFTIACSQPTNWIVRLDRAITLQFCISTLLILTFRFSFFQAIALKPPSHPVTVTFLMSTLSTVHPSFGSISMAYCGFVPLMFAILQLLMVTPSALVIDIPCLRLPRNRQSDIIVFLLPPPIYMQSPQQSAIVNPHIVTLFDPFSLMPIPHSPSLPVCSYLSPIMLPLP